MKKILKYAIFLFLIFTSIQIMAQVSFQRTYGGTGNDRALSVEVCNDGGYIMAGYTTSFGEGELDFLIIKTDSLGEVEWSKTYGGTYSEQANVIKQTSDNGYIIGGYTESYGTTSKSSYIIKIDSIGTIEWTKIYSNGGECNSILTNSNGEIIALLEGVNLLQVVKLSSSGNELWSKINLDNASTIYTSYKSRMIELSNGNILIGSATNSFTNGNCYLLCLNANGNLVWAKNFVGNKVRGLCELSNGEIICSIEDPTSNDFDIGWLKITSSGNILGYRRIFSDFRDVPTSIVPIGNDVILSGETAGFNQNQTSAYSMKIDNDGTLLWSKIYKPGVYNTFASMDLINKSSNPIYAGTMLVNGSIDALLVRTDENGNSMCNDSIVSPFDTNFTYIENMPTPIIQDSSFNFTSGGIENTPIVAKNTFCLNVKGCMNPDASNYNPIATEDDGSCILGMKKFSMNDYIQVYPNPSKGSFFIEGMKSPVMIHIYDAKGSLIQQYKLQTIKTEITLPIKGIYVVTIQTEKELITKKVSIQ